jgi:hypothetical protein
MVVFSIFACIFVVLTPHLSVIAFAPVAAASLITVCTRACLE